MGGRALGRAHVDDASRARLKADCGIGFEHLVFHTEQSKQVDILGAPRPATTRLDRS